MGYSHIPTCATSWILAEDGLKSQCHFIVGSTAVKLLLEAYTVCFKFPVVRILLAG